MFCLTCDVICCICVVLLDEDGDKYIVLTVSDKKNYMIGSLLGYDHNLPYVQHCKDLICVCALVPMIGIPRRPLKVTFKEPEIAE